MAKGNRNGARDKERARKRQNAERQARLREIRDANGQCRTCGRPAVRSKRTGKLSRQCRRHLKVDNDRKGVVELAWSRRPARANGGLLHWGPLAGVR